MKFVFLCIAVASSFAPLLVTCLNTDCTVKTELGGIRGKVEESRNGKKFCAFLGIPFAEPAKRFTEAELKEKWDGILDAQELGPWCPQMAGDKVIGDENCLVLNVHSPIGDQCSGQQNGTDDASQAVFVHIHGGSYSLNSGGLFGPKYLMDECIVYVSINYRLGALGFLTTENGLIPGNLGLKDQRLALQWVQMNIKGFGGNSKLVTIDGISAGSCSVSHLVASTSAKGLFQRAIAQSGSAVNPWGISKNPGKTARQLGQRLNCTSSDSNKVITTAELKQCLLSQDAKDIVLNQHKLLKPLPFGPVVERPRAKNAFHKINPYYKMKFGLINRVPMIQGFCEDEGLILDALGVMRNKPFVAQLNERWREAAPYLFCYDEDYIPQERRNEFSDKIRQFYFGKQNISEETLQNLTNLFSDRYFVQGTFENVESHAMYAPVYPYVLSYTGSFSLAQTQGYTKPAATHADDAQYFYDFDARFPPLKRGSSDEKMSQQLIKAWLSFARTGKPTETWPTPNQWKQYKNSSSPWLQINSTLEEIPNYLAERRQFWKDLGLNRYDYPLF